jgi:secreted protein with Ig-like and vWFA domain
MSSVTLELEETLHQLDGRSALLLEQLVRDALALVRQKSNSSKGWPPEYFQKTAGSFANEPLDIPSDPPPTANPDW